MECEMAESYNSGSPPDLPAGQEAIGAGAGGFFTTGAGGGAPAKYPPGWKCSQFVMRKHLVTAGGDIPFLIFASEIGNKYLRY